VRMVYGTVHAGRCVHVNSDCPDCIAADSYEGGLV